MSNAAFLERLWATDPTPGELDGVPAWWSRHQEATRGLEDPFERAVVGAAHMDRLAYAFGSGYVGALQALVPELTGVKAALCATEEGGAHPRAIRTRLERKGEGDGWVVSGEKAFVTLGSQADVLLVVVSEGQDPESGRNRLALVRVARDAAGVTMMDLPETPFAPELRHARVGFDRTPVEARLPGDGYADYLKPFRTVEDVFVHGALLAWALQVGRRASWPRELQEEGLALLCAAHQLAGADPQSLVGHLALGGLLARTRAWLEATEPHWEAVDEGSRARWERDRALLEVAGGARRRRLEVAWERIGR